MATQTAEPKESIKNSPEAVVVRFAGDSGDGMQLTGGQFTLSSALAGNDFATFPDFPAEIRAPQGTLFGVSAFQINFGSTEIDTAGDAPDVLVAMNPAALKTNVGALKPGGLIIADTGEFTKRNLEKAKYEVNPLEDGSLSKWQVLAFDISALTMESVKPFGLGNKEALRCKNMWTLGLALWMFDRDRQPLIDWLNGKFKKNPVLAEANIAALNAGHAYGETAEIGGQLHKVHLDPVDTPAGLYRTITGAEAVALGLVAGAQLAHLPMFFGGYPITPASSILHYLVGLKEFGVTTFQAEDEIAAIASAIGASYAGQLGVTSSSGPGIALKTEAMGLAAMTELPLVIVNSQRGGPSTGLPTKTPLGDPARPRAPVPARRAGGVRRRRRAARPRAIVPSPRRRHDLLDQVAVDAGDSRRTPHRVRRRAFCHPDICRARVVAAGGERRPQRQGRTEPRAGAKSAGASGVADRSSVSRCEANCASCRMPRPPRNASGCARSMAWAPTAPTKTKS